MLISGVGVAVVGAVARSRSAGPQLRASRAISRKSSGHSTPIRDTNMATTTMPEPTVAALEAAQRVAGERYAELEREASNIDRMIADAAHRRDAGAVVWLEQRKRELPAEVAA